MTEVDKELAERYNVVFRYNSKAGGYAGVKTWSSFKSKAAFHEWLRRNPRENEDVVAEGVTAEEAKAMASSTPTSSYFNAAMDDATDPKTGEVDAMRFYMNIANASLIGKL